jgi:NitT/TauT family transport system substrate-binding protein
MNRFVSSLLAAAAIGFATLGAAQAQPRDRFVYGVPSTISSAIANFSFAEELGYFDEARINLELIALPGSGVTIPQLLSNQLQSTGASLEPQVIARAPGGQNFPLIFTYNYLRNSVWEFAVMADSEIRTIADLRARTIGITSLSAGNIFMTRAMVQAQGVPWNEVRVLAVGFGVQAFEALRTNQVQVLNLWDSMHEAMEQGGMRIRRLPIPPQFDGMSSHGFLFTQRMLRENPDLIVRFSRAVTKGSVACQANPEGCLAAFWRRNPARRPANADTPDVHRREMAIMTSRMNNVVAFRPGEPREWGRFPERDWTALIDALKLGGQIPQDANIPHDQLYTNALVPEINRFDNDAVVAQARAYR